jgi:predicted PurR-regulated permease PerM
MTDPSEPPNIKFLRRLVTVLTATMIFGLLVVIGLLVIRFSSQEPNLPDVITLPGGEKAAAFTQGADWYAVVTQDNQILIFDRPSGALRQTVDIE